jgi:hypothetical protein
MKKYLVWSNQHSAWWGPYELGYTRVIDGAGRYSKKEAEKIVRKSTLNGQLTSRMWDATKNQSIEVPNEVMVKWVDFDPKETT